MTSSYENEEKENRRIDIETSNPWLQNRNMEDIDRQSSKIADHFVDNHLRGTDMMNSNTIKRELAAYYSMNDETLQRFTIRKIAHHPKTDSAIDDYSKSDSYYIKYKRD
jgi:hypothetical protein